MKSWKRELLFEEKEYKDILEFLCNNFRKLEKHDILAKQIITSLNGYSKIKIGTEYGTKFNLPVKTSILLTQMAHISGTLYNSNWSIFGIEIIIDTTLSDNTFIFIPQTGYENYKITDEYEE